MLVTATARRLRRARTVPVRRLLVLVYRLFDSRNWGVEEPHQPPGSPGSDDRRAHARFSLSLPLHYTVLPRRRRLKTGEGRTVDVSSSGVHFVSDGSLKPGDRLEVALDWPLMLHGEVSQRLIVLGTVVWAQGDHIGVQFQRHQFKTRGAGRKLA